MARPTPLLDLDTLIVRPTIRVDGEPYELLSIDELSILDSQRLTAWGHEIEALSGSGDEEDGRKLGGLVATVARKALVDMPDDVFARLSEAHHMSVAEVFTGLLLTRKLATAGALVGEMVNRSTGAKSSPGSSGSTEATPCTGSGKSPEPS